MSMYASTMKKTLGRLAVIVAAFSLWTSAIAAPNWKDAVDDLRAAHLAAGHVEAIVTQAKNRGVPPEMVRVWAERMKQSQQAGVPAALMGERLVQGLVKGVPVARIDQALANLQANLTWAKQEIDRHAAKAEIRRRPEAVEQAARQLEAALRAGFERAQMEQMLGNTMLTLEQIARLAGVASNLRTWGIKPERAVRALAHAGSAGMTAVELARLEHQFAGGIAVGRAPKDLMIEFERGVEKFIATHPVVEGLMERGDGMREDMKHEPMRDFGGSPAQDRPPTQQDIGGSGPTPGDWKH